MKYFETLVFNTHGDYPQSKGVSHVGTFRDYYGIQYNHSGKLFLAVGNDPPVTVEGPYAFITCPGIEFNYGSPGNEFRHHCFLCFSGTLVDRFLKGGLLLPRHKNALIPIVHSERFYSTFSSLHQVLAHPGGTNLPRTAWMLEDLLLQLQEQPGIRSRINAFCEHRIHQLQEEIRLHPQHPWDFEEEAGRLSISYSHFRRIFREVTGSAPNQYLIGAKLNLAEKLLRDTVLPMDKVAHQSGFPDEFYFSRLFKKHRNISPSACRKEFAGKGVLQSL